MNDYYFLLGVRKNATDQEIKTAYRKLSKKFHPDLNDGDSFFAERFKEIQKAYETLSDSSKKKNYDFLIKNYDSKISNSEYTTKKEPTKKEPQENDNDFHNPSNNPKSSIKKDKSSLITFSIIFLILIGITFFVSKIISQTKSSSEKNQTEIVSSEKKLMNDWITGNWNGLITQFDIKEKWHVSLHLNLKNNVFDIKYPTLNCGGYLEMIEQSNGKIIFEETLTYGRVNCTVGGTVIIEKIEDEFYYSYYSQENKLTSKGKLINKEIPKAVTKSTSEIIKEAEESLKKPIKISRSEDLNEITNPKTDNSNLYINNKLRNGTSPLDECFGKGIYQGKAYIKFLNSNKTDAIVCLVNRYSNKVIRNEYIRAGSDFEMSKIPSGDYFIKVYYGNGWNPNKTNFCGIKGAFTKDIHFSKSDNLSDVISVENSEYSYTTGSITLYSVPNGNMSSQNIDETEFFN